MKLEKRNCYKLIWAEAAKIVEDEIFKIVGHPVLCSAQYVDDSYWGVKFEGRLLPLAELCKIMQALYSSKEEWEDALPDEWDEGIHDIDGRLAEKLIQRNLRLSCEHYLLEKDCLWLVDVKDSPIPRKEIVSIGNTEICFAELKSKDELFNFFQEGSCDHKTLMEFCEDYKARYGNDLCWSYPIETYGNLGCYLVLVREGVLYLPIDQIDVEDYELFYLEEAELLNTDRLIELADEFRMFTNGLLTALNDMIIYTQAKERSGS